jgi:hypothetical protein
MKTNGEWRYSSTVIDLGTRWRWVVRFTPRPLYSRRKSHWYRLAGWEVPRAGLDAVEKRNISCSCRESNPGYPTHSYTDWAVCYVTNNLRLIFWSQIKRYSFFFFKIVTSSDGGEINSLSWILEGVVLYFFEAVYTVHGSSKIRPTAAFMSLLK